MDLLLHLTVVVIIILISNPLDGDSARTKRRILDFRKMAKVFVRYNIKVNVVPYTSLFAFAMGFRANWNVKPSTVIHPKRRIALLNNANRIFSTDQQQSNQSQFIDNEYLSNQYPINQYAYNQYPNDQYQSNQYTSNPYPNNQYQNYQYQSNHYPNDQHKSNQFMNYQYQRVYQPHSYYQRAIHSAVQSAFDWHGLNGSACLQRTFCEVSVIHQDDVISQIFKIVFNGTEEFDCPEDIHCPVSLLQLVDHILAHSQPVTAD